MSDVKKQSDTLKTFGQLTDEDYLADCIDILNSYYLQANSYMILHSILQLIIALGAALTAFTVIYPDVPKLIPAILSAIVVLSTGISNYYHFDRVSIGYRRAADTVKAEMKYFQAGVEEYNNLNPKEALQKFMEKVNAAKNGRLSNWDALSTSSN